MKLNVPADYRQGVSDTRVDSTRIPGDKRSLAKSASILLTLLLIFVVSTAAQSAPVRTSQDDISSTTEIPALPASFQSRTIPSPAGADIFVRWGGQGPVVVLLHGYAENSDSWAPLARDLMKDHTVVGPRSSRHRTFIET